ncbi:cellulose binding domain-containing protein (plasmid) [Microvirga sp. RSM25]|uniref:cellulose binding domain-containing protein n=1 Tax=Microvirga sp. RSM25 TaxID=3273802 RepID=UPI00384A7885
MSFPSLRSIDFLVSGEPGALITVTETVDGRLDFHVRVTDVIANDIDRPDTADLRGLFFHVSTESVLAGLSVSGANVTNYAVSANGVMEVQGDVTMSGEVGKAVGPFDIGIEFGTSGIGKDDIKETTFTLASSAPLSLELVLQQYFGLRLTSVSDNGQGRALSLKLAGQLTGTPKIINQVPTDPAPTDPTPDNPTPTPVDPTPIVTIPGGSFDDLIEAGDGNDTIHGGLGNDEMQGEGGDDVIAGGKDDGHLSWIDGALGVTIGDNLYGNDGLDTYLYKKGDGVDLIWDFQPGQDVIRLTGYALADVDSFTFVRTVGNRIPTDPHDKIAIILDDGGDALVFNDFPGPSADDVAIVFADGTTLSSARLLELAAAHPTAGAPAGASGLATRSSAVTSSAKPLDLYGGNGDDILIGGLGHDRLYGNEGANGLNGRDGNDQLFGGNVRDTLLGDQGDDIGYGNGGDDLIIGGSGADKLYGAGGADLIYGDDGEGVDLPTTLTSYTPAVPGEEVHAAIRITNNWWGGFQGEITVTANESVNDWGVFLKSKFNIDSIWGARTVAEANWDQGVVYDLNNAEWNGALAAGQTTTIGFTARTGFNGVVDVQTLLAGLGIEKRISTDALPSESLLSALGNTMRGYAGADLLVGTMGNDTYYVDNAGDQVIEAYAAGANDKVVTTVDYTLSQNVEVLSAEGAASGLSLTGNGLDNEVTGSAGADKINGGGGKDLLTGGRGKDAFVFDKKFGKSNVDRVADFNVKDDTVRLDNAVFKKLGKAGKLKKDFFKIGTKAADADDHVIYNSKKGMLYYDADGNGKGAAVHFATLSKNLKLTQADVIVI